MNAKVVVFLFLFAIIFALVAPSRSLLSAEPASSQPVAKLTVRVVDLRDHKGQLIFSVFNQPDGFPNVQKKSKNWQIKAIDADTVTFECELPPGVYAASVLHDENKNNQMDRSAVGIPQEGYGVTNNPKPRLRQATFKEATFTLPPEGTTMTISVQYF
jgi:uncharacterized protein (DUF2141 family)